MNFRHIALAAAAIALAPMAFAGTTTTITGLKNTGAGFAADAQDTNYTLSVAGGSTGNGYVSDMTGWPDDGTWIVSGSSVSKWLTPTANESQSFDAAANGTYTWTLDFNLSGYLPNSASFSGRWAADNKGVVKLNGAAISTISVSTGFRDWTSFEATSGFVSGANKIEFVVTNLALNGGNPTGLRAEFTTSSVTAVPEPETYAMLMAGLGLLGAVARRKKSIQSA